MREHIRPQSNLSQLEIFNLKRVFRVLDSNSDKLICERDLTTSFRHKKIHVPRREVKDILWECDDLGTGALDFNAFCRLYTHVKDNKNEPSRLFSFILYSMFDKDDSGDITPEEFYTLVFPRTGSSAVTAMVNSLPHEGASVQAGQFVRLMQSSAWRERIGDEDKGWSIKPRKKISITCRHIDAKKIFQHSIESFNMSQLDTSKNTVITDSSMRRDREEALRRAQLGLSPGYEDALSPQTPVKKKKPTPKIKHEREMRETVDFVDYSEYFLEENCTSEESRVVRAAAKEVGVDILLAEKVLATFNEIDADNSGLLECEEFMEFVQRVLFNGSASQDRLRACWNECIQTVTDKGQPLTLSAVTFPLFLRWYSRRFGTDGQSTSTPTEEMYASLGRKRLAERVKNPVFDE